MWGRMATQTLFYVAVIERPLHPRHNEMVCAPNKYFFF
jgi:hypothetical protein